jgi:predicted nucleic acid-binding protein
VRVLVDTSVWIDFANGHPSDEAALLAQLIEEGEDVLTCGVIAAEFLQGLRSSRAVRKFSAHFRDMEWLSPQEPDTYEASATLYRDLRKKGVTIRSTIDCLITRLAEDDGCFLLARDRDMTQILSSGLVDLEAFGSAAWPG